MQNTVLLETRFPGLQLRLQLPTLTAGKVHQRARMSVSSGGYQWEAHAGEVSLIGSGIQIEPNQWHFDFSLRNNGPDLEARVALPYIFYHFPEDQPVRIFQPEFGGVLDYPVAGYPFRTHYPGHAGACLTAAIGRDYGFAVGMFDLEQRHIEIRHIPTARDGQIQFLLERVLVKQGHTVSLPRMYVAAGLDWAAAMDPYREWHQANYHRPRPRPDWYVNEPFTETRRAHCLAPFNPPSLAEGVWVFDDQGTPRVFEQVKSEVDLAIREGEEQGYKPLFYQFGWWATMGELRGLYMFDTLCGDYTEAHELAVRIIEYIHERGMRTYLYTNAISAGTESRVFAARPELFVRDAQGQPCYNSEYPLYLFCPGAPGMHAYWDQTLQYMLGTLGADGIFLDQVCGGFPPSYCYDPAHEHDHPDTYGQDMIALVDYIGRRAREIRPDAYVGGELWLDSRASLLDEAHGYAYRRVKSKPPSTIEEQRSTPLPEEFIFTRFLSPTAFSQRGATLADVMNGAAGSHADPLWREHRSVFESQVAPCRVEPAGALAYLFGPVKHTSILAVRSQGEVGTFRVKLPGDLRLQPACRMGYAPKVALT